MRQLRRSFVLFVTVLSLFVFGCGPSQSTQPAAQAPVQPQKPAVEAKPAAQPAAQPAQPAAQPAKPAAVQPAAKPKAEAQRIFWGGGPIVSPYYAYAAAAAKVINDAVPATQVTVSEMTGAVAGLKRLQSKEFGMLSTQLGLVYEAYKGLEQFKGSPISDLRVLWTINVTGNAYVVRQDSGVTKIADLNGHEFAGGTGTYTEVLARQGLSAIGVEPKWYRGGLQDALAATRDKRIAGFVKSVGLTGADAGIIEVQTATQIRLLDWPKELIEQVKQKYEYHVDGVIPAGVYKNAGNDQPIRTWVAPVVVVASKGLDPEIAYQIVKAVEANKDPQKAAFAPSGASDFAKLTAELSPLPVHAGVLRYIRERGLPIRPGIVPPEAR